MDAVPSRHFRIFQASTSAARRPRRNMKKKERDDVTRVNQTREIIDESNERLTFVRDEESAVPFIGVRRHGCLARII